MPIYAAGEKIKSKDGEKIAIGKEPIGLEWGLKRWGEFSLRETLDPVRHPGRGLGFGLGPGRLGEQWLIDLEGDGPMAQESLNRLVGETLETMGWGSTRGSHSLFIADGDRLLELLHAAGAKRERESPESGTSPSWPTWSFASVGSKRMGGPSSRFSPLCRPRQAPMASLANGTG